MKEYKNTKKLIKLLDQIKQSGFTGYSLMIHDVDLDELDHTTWIMSGNVTDNGRRFWSATSDEYPGVTLFE